MKYLKTFENFNYVLDPLEVNEILKGYIEAALWTEEENIEQDYKETFPDVDDYKDDYEYDLEDTDLEKEMRDKFQSKPIEKFSEEDIDPNSLIKAYTDIKQFISLAGQEAIEHALEENAKNCTSNRHIQALQQMGHDIWLTRNHHGAGFFDHSYDDDMEKLLMDAAHKLGEIHIFINDDIKLSFSNE